MVLLFFTFSVSFEKLSCSKLSNYALTWTRLYTRGIMLILIRNRKNFKKIEAKCAIQSFCLLSLFLSCCLNLSFCANRNFDSFSVKLDNNATILIWKIQFTNLSSFFSYTASFLYIEKQKNVHCCCGCAEIPMWLTIE